MEMLNFVTINNKHENYAKDIRILRVHILLLLQRARANTVHVLHGGKESIFDLIMMNGELAEIHVREKHGAEPLPEKDKRTAELFIRKYHKNIIDKWVKFFVMKQSIRSTNIKKKL